MIPWWVFSICASATLVGVEYLNRTLSGGWVVVLPKTLPLIVLAQWLLFRTFQGGPHWLTTWAVFSIGTTICRVSAVSYFQNQEVTSWNLTLLGIAVMFAGGLLIKAGMNS